MNKAIQIAIGGYGTDGLDSHLPDRFQTKRVSLDSLDSIVAERPDIVVLGLRSEEDLSRARDAGTYVLPLTIAVTEHPFSENGAAHHYITLRSDKEVAEDILAIHYLSQFGALKQERKDYSITVNKAIKEVAPELNSQTESYKKLPDYRKHSRKFGINPTLGFTHPLGDAYYGAVDKDNTKLYGTLQALVKYINILEQAGHLEKREVA